MERVRAEYRSRSFSILVIVLLFSGLAQADTQQGPLPVDPMEMAHSHNDYLQKRPLFDALSNGFRSVEADVFLMSGRLILSHVGIITYGSFEEVYLEPLQALVNQRGSVYGDGMPFTLWIDLKGSPDGMAVKLIEVLSRYPMLSWYTDSGVEQNAVTVVLTGDETAKKDFVERYPTRPGTRDSNDFTLTFRSPDWRWNWYALSWSDYLDWDGKGSISASEFAKLRKILGAIHGSGKRVRFYDAPETEAYWGLMQSEGSDLVGSDHLSKMRDYLLAHPVIQSIRSIFSI